MIFKKRHIAWWISKGVENPNRNPEVRLKISQALKGRKNPKIKWKRTYQETLKHYKKYGYKCLIMWFNEMKSMKEREIVEKISNFTEGRNVV